MSGVVLLGDSKENCFPVESQGKRRCSCVFVRASLCMLQQLLAAVVPLTPAVLLFLVVAMDVGVGASISCCCCCWFVAAAVVLVIVVVSYGASRFWWSFHHLL